MTLIGRDSERARLRSLVDERAQPVILLSGETGMGKSALLRSLEDDLIAEGRSVWHVDLRSQGVGGSMATAIARGVGITVVDPERALPFLIGAIGDDRVLVALDHADGVFDAAELRAIADACPGAAFVVALTAAPSGQGQGLHVGPLPVPHPQAGREQRLANPAVRLFVDTADRSGAAVAWDDADLEAAAEICTRLGGSPLAIMLAAARCTHLGPVALLTALSAGPDPGFLRVASGEVTVDASVSSSLSATLGSLRESQRALLRTLGAMRGTFSLRTATAMAPAESAESLVDDLERMIDLHLIEVVHPDLPAAGEADVTAADTATDPALLIPAFVQSYLRSTGGSSAPDPRLLAHLRGLTTEAARVLIAGEFNEAVDDALVARVDVARAVLASLEDPTPASVRFAVEAMTVLAGYTEGDQIGGALYDISSHPVMADLDPALAGQVWIWSARAVAQSPDGALRGSDVRARWERGRAMLDPKVSPHLVLQADLAGLSASILAPVMPFTRKVVGEGLSLARALASPGLTARFEAWASAVAHSSGDVPKAVQFAATALDRGQRSGDRTAIMGATLMLHTVPQGSVPEDLAVPTLEQALALARPLREDMVESMLLAAIARRELLAHRPTEAARWCLRRLETIRRRGWSEGIGISLVHAVLIASQLGDSARVARIHGRLRSDEARILHGMAPASAPLLQAAVERAREAMGAAAFTHEGTAGALLTARQIGIETIAWLRAHTDRSAARQGAGAAVTEREREVLELLARGLTNKDIGAVLNLSPKTVMHHSVAIYRKLHVRGSAEATAHAYRTGLLSGEGRA